MNTLQSKFGDMFKCVHGLINETKSSDAHSHTSPGTQAYQHILTHHQEPRLTITFLHIFRYLGLPSHSQTSQNKRYYSSI